MFTFILVVFVVVFLLTCVPFFMLMFVVVVSSTIICKQVCVLHCFVFLAVVYKFNVKRYKGKAPAFRFFHFACGIHLIVIIGRLPSIRISI